MTKLKRITTPADLAAVNQGLLDEGGLLLAPTHAIESEGELIGAASIAALPTVHYWFSKEKCQALQSVRALRQVDGMLKEAGVNLYQTLCPDRSPFMPVLERLGYLRPFGDTSTLFIKKLGERK